MSAFAAGAVAAVNPCGFALLPAFLGQFLAKGKGAGEHGTRQRLGAGLLLGTLLTLGLLSVFALIGLLIGTVGYTLGRYFPHLGLLVAALLLIFGVYTLSGRELQFRTGLLAPEGRGAGSFFLFGATYGLASLDCALAEFLIVTGLALSQGGGMAFLIFAAYGLGMGAVLSALGLTVALGKGAFVHLLRRAGAHVQALSGVLLVGAGGYLIAYNLGFLAFDYALGRWFGAGAALAALLVGVALRIFGHPKEVMSL